MVCDNNEAERAGVMSEGDPDKRAPGPLSLVQRFVNSAHLETGEDELETPQALADWLSACELAPAGVPVSVAEHRRARDIREGLRALLFVNNGGEPDAAAIERLEHAAARAELRGRFDGERPELVPFRQGSAGALARLLAIVVEAAADGSWERLKACADSDCRWAFYDHSKNRSGRWCTMAVCGNQQKARAYRERRRAATA